MTSTSWLIAAGWSATGVDDAGAGVGESEAPGATVRDGLEAEGAEVEALGVALAAGLVACVAGVGVGATVHPPHTVTRIRKSDAIARPVSRCTGPSGSGQSIGQSLSDVSGSTERNECPVKAELSGR